MKIATKTAIALLALLPAGFAHAVGAEHYATASYSADGSVSAAGSYSKGGGDVISEAERWKGSGNMTRQPGPWCAAFVSFILQRTGHAPLPNDMAGSALAYGRRLSEPKVGALAVIRTRRGYEGHVGFVAGVNPDGTIELVSGNWSHRVADATISRRQVTAFVDVI